MSKTLRLIALVIFVIPFSIEAKNADGPYSCSGPSKLKSSTVNHYRAELTWIAASGVYDYVVWSRESGGSWQNYLSTGISFQLPTLPNKSYEVYVASVCEGVAGRSETIFFTTPDYCTSVAERGGAWFIDFVALESLVHESGFDLTSDFTSMDAPTLTKGSYSAIALSANDVHNSPMSSSPQKWRVWIDFNRDGDFLDASEEVVRTTAVTHDDFNLYFHVPTTAATGKTRMRVTMFRILEPVPCGFWSEGEVQDYTVNVVSDNGTSSERKSCDVKQVLTETNILEDKMLSIYPNPVVNTLKLELSDAKNIELSINNSEGMLYWKGENISEVDVSFLKPGIYFISVKTEGELKTLRFVKE